MPACEEKMTTLSVLCEVLMEEELHLCLVCKKDTPDANTECTRNSFMSKLHRYELTVPIATATSVSAENIPISHSPMTGTGETQQKLHRSISIGSVSVFNVKELDWPARSPHLNSILHNLVDEWVKIHASKMLWEALREPGRRIWLINAQVSE